MLGTALTGVFREQCSLTEPRVRVVHGLWFLVQFNLLKTKSPLAWAFCFEMVEPAGIEPASASLPKTVLHT